MAIELYENKGEKFFIIKDGDSVLKMTEEEFNRLKKNGKSPLLTRLWQQAKKERMAKGEKTPQTQPSFNVKDAVKNFLRTNGILELEKDRRLVAVAQLVSKIPWGEGRSIMDVLVLKKTGTCTGKHLLLQACFDELGIKYQPVVCTFRWGDQDIRYPENLKAILAEGEWEHGHNFVQVTQEDGSYTDLDVTWDSKLKPYGFKVLPDDWDGKTPFVAVDKIVRRWDGADVEADKKGLVESMSAETRERRGRFLKEFIKWVDSIHA